jgi:hypothetical protein
MTCPVGPHARCCPRFVSIDKTDVKTSQGNTRHVGPVITLSKYARRRNAGRSDAMV